MCAFLAGRLKTVTTSFQPTSLLLSTSFQTKRILLTIIKRSDWTIIGNGLDYSARPIMGDRLNSIAIMDHGLKFWFFKLSLTMTAIVGNGLKYWFFKLSPTSTTILGNGPEHCFSTSTLLKSSKQTWFEKVG